MGASGPYSSGIHQYRDSQGSNPAKTPVASKSSADTNRPSTNRPSARVVAGVGVDTGWVGWLESGGQRGFFWSMARLEPERLGSRACTTAVGMAQSHLVIGPRHPAGRVAKGCASRVDIVVCVIWASKGF